MPNASDILDIDVWKNKYIVSCQYPPVEENRFENKEQAEALLAKLDSVEALEDRVKELEALLENIIHHQFNKTSSLANLNGAIASARNALKKQTTKTKYIC